MNFTTIHGKSTGDWEFFAGKIFHWLHFSDFIFIVMTTSWNKLTCIPFIRLRK